MAIEQSSYEHPVVLLSDSEERAAIFDDIDRRDDSDYPDDIDPYGVQVAASEGMPDAYYQEWEEEVSPKTYAGVYIDDDTMDKLLKILSGKGGYFQLGGLLQAYKSGNKDGTPQNMRDVETKMQSQLEGVHTLLWGETAAESVQEVTRTHQVINAIKDRFSGSENKTELDRERRRLRKEIGDTALRSVAD